MREFDISYMCKFFSSSISDWEKWKIGSPIDGYDKGDRYSVHTESEEGSFVRFNLPVSIYITRVVVVLRDEYNEGVLPIAFKCYNKNVLIKKSVINGLDDSEIFIGGNLDTICISNDRLRPVVFSSVKIFASAENLIKSSNIIKSNFDRFVYVFTPFYGLGGKLAVVASSLGFLSKQSDIKQTFLSKEYDGLIAYPLVSDAAFCEKTRSAIKNNLAPCFADYLCGLGGYKSHKDISKFSENGDLTQQDRKVVLLTRDSISSYKINTESYISVKRRLYSRILPSENVIKASDKIRSEKFFTDEYNAVTLGVHVRHGNGEKYHSISTGIWGVKPPSPASVVLAIRKILSVNKSIVNIVLCTDCRSVFDYIRREFPNHEVCLLSDLIQPIGFGCNHNTALWHDIPNRCTPDQAAENLRAFSEIIVMSNFKYICGGHSYFFDAIVGFSTTAESNVYYLIDNNDRYVRNIKGEPVVNSTKLIAIEIKSFLDFNGILLDGLFILFHVDDSFAFFYFDILLYDGSLSGFMSSINDIKAKIVRARFY